ncbi:Proteasome subunit beta type [Rhynchospora pubera]|uniref:Proteasome subunit beta type-1 n=2 Tax=Rhynchospora pubera TaxID=906938 RepID=A0AAV8EFL6_9POAL|nr:Proteasome subunit beta type [Rhynchospora pubera]
MAWPCPASSAVQPLSSSAPPCPSLAPSLSSLPKGTRSLSLNRRSPSPSPLPSLRPELTTSPSHSPHKLHLSPPSHPPPSPLSPHGKPPPPISCSLNLTSPFLVEKEKQSISSKANTEKQNPLLSSLLLSLLSSIKSPTMALRGDWMYENNGGTCVAIAGIDYCVVAADTRLSVGYNILTRDHSKICSLADKVVLASSGFQGDIRALHKNLAARHLLYQHQHNKQMSCPAMGQLLSNTLYYKRFFPYYAFNVLGGLDNEGKGCVFTYDAVGSYERVGYSTQGSGSSLIMPVLDNQLKSPSPLLLPARDAVTPLSETEAVDLVKDVFASATERDIYTGDKLEIVVINASGIKREYLELRKD